MWAHLPAPSQSPILPNQVLIAEWCSNMLKSQHKHSAAIAVHSRNTIQTHCTNSYYWYPNAHSHDTVCSQLLGSTWVKLSSSQLLFSKPILRVFQVLHLISVWVTHRLRSLTGLAISGKHYSQIIMSGKAVYAIWWLSGTAVYLKQKLPSSPPHIHFSLLYVNSSLLLTFFLELIILAHVLWVFLRCRYQSHIPTPSPFRIVLAHVSCRKKWTFLPSGALQSGPMDQKGRTFQGLYFLYVKKEGSFSGFKKSLGFHSHLQVSDNNHSNWLCREGSFGIPTRPGVPGFFSFSSYLVLIGSDSSFFSSLSWCRQVQRMALLYKENLNGKLFPSWL